MANNKYRYTFMDDPENTSEIFKDKKTMRKHLALYMPEDFAEVGILIEANGCEYFIDDPKQLESYLSMEDMEE